MIKKQFLKELAEVVRHHDLQSIINDLEEEKNKVDVRLAEFAIREFFEGSGFDTIQHSKDVVAIVQDINSLSKTKIQQYILHALYIY